LSARPAATAHFLAQHAEVSSTTASLSPSAGLPSRRTPFRHAKRWLPPFSGSPPLLRLLMRRAPYYAAPPRHPVPSQMILIRLLPRLIFIIFATRRHACL